MHNYANIRSWFIEISGQWLREEALIVGLLERWKLYREISGAVWWFDKNFRACWPSDTWHAGSVFRTEMSRNKFLSANPTLPAGAFVRSLHTCSSGERKTILTRSFCLSGGEREDTGSRTSHFSVTGWRSAPDKGSLIFTLTSNLPPVALRPSITYETHTHCSIDLVCTCVFAHLCVQRSPLWPLWCHSGFLEPLASAEQCPPLCQS